MAGHGDLRDPHPHTDFPPGQIFDVMQQKCFPPAGLHLLDHFLNLAKLVAGNYLLVRSRNIGGNFESVQIFNRF